jgi:hypothetical protein
MNYDDLPDRWKEKVKAYLVFHGVTDRERFNAFDFYCNQIAKITFDDGSFAQFHFPLVIEAPELNEVGVFTEHCGYHIFTMVGTHVAIESVV